MYVGKTIHPQNRFAQHVRQARNGSKQVVHQAIRKHGPESFYFHVIEECVSEKDSLIREQFWIHKFDTTVSGWGYNMTHGGENFKPTEELRRVLSDSGKRYFESPEARQKQSDAIKAYFQTPGAKELQSQVLKLYYATPGAKERNSEALKRYYQQPGAIDRCKEVHNKRYSDPEERKKVSEAIKAHYLDPENRKKNKDRQIEAWKSPIARLNQSNAQKLRHSTPEMIAYKSKIIELYAQGCPMKDIAAEVGRHWTTVRTVLIKAGVYVFHKDKK